MELPGTIRAAALLAALLACGCSAPPRAEPGADGGGGPRIKRQTDQLCINDCLGSGGTPSFCEDRCTD